MIKKIGVVLFTLFAVEVAGCKWFWDQKPVCDPDAVDYAVCINPPPLPPMAVQPDTGTDADADGEVGEPDEDALMCPTDTGSDGG